MKKVIRISALFLFAILLCWNCAQTAMPSGGPKDEDPPVVLECIPENYSTLFTARRIQVTFDEYIVLENVNQQLVVSPPMKEKPEVRLKGKSLLIQFEEDLKENTTYTFNFGDAIKDLHEGNKLQNYEYVFSTGEVLDSMSVRGTIQMAGTLAKPEGSLSVMLYTDLHDSVPIRDIPLYIGRSDDSGVFSVNNLRPDVYKLFALKDANNNFLFDLPTEEIAFLDSSLILTPEFIKSVMGPKTDSMGTETEAQFVDTLAIVQDSSMISTDSTLNDSLRPPAPDYSTIYANLLLFTEASEIQYIMEYKRDDRRKLELVFALPLSEQFSYHFLEKGLLLEEDLVVDYPVVEQPGVTGDSLTIWLRDSLDYNKDSIFIALSYLVKDSAEQMVPQYDTLLLSFREKAKKGRKEKTEEKKVEKLKLDLIKNRGDQDIHRSVKIGLDFPLEEVHDSLVRFYHIPDTIPFAKDFSFQRDKFWQNRLWLVSERESEAKYRVEFYPGALQSIYPIEHDTLIRNFTVRDVEYYGQILLSLEEVKGQVIVQLYAGKNLVGELAVDQDGLYKFPYLAPKEYRIKFIHDRNRNGKWDTGSYLEKIQPEDVEFVQVGINVRSNWDHEVKFTLEK